MKKLISLILCVGMCMSITACGNDNSMESIVESTSSGVTSNVVTSVVSDSNSDLYIVPNLIGKTQYEAFEVLHEVGLEGQVYFDLDSPDDNPIKSQNVKPGIKLSKNSVVEFYIGEEEDYFSYSGDIDDNQIETYSNIYYVPSKLEMKFNRLDDSNIESCTEIDWDFSNNRIGRIVELYGTEYYYIECNNEKICKLIPEEDTTAYTVFYYDEENRVYEKDNYLHNELDSKTYIEYSGNRRTIKNSKYDEITTEHFDDNGNIIFREILADRFSDGVATYEYEYDEYSNIIGHSDFDVYIKDRMYDDGKIISGRICSSDWDYINNSKITYQYDYTNNAPSSIAIDNDAYQITINVEYQGITENKYKSLLEISRDIELQNLTMINVGNADWFPLECFYNFFKP